MSRAFVVVLLAGFLLPGCEDPAPAPTVDQRPSDAEVYQSIQERWRGLRLGMTGDEVQSLIGPAAQVHQEDTMAWWYYYPELGGARVRLAPTSVFDDHWRVTGWSELDWGVMSAKLSAERAAERNRILEAYILSRALQ